MASRRAALLFLGTAGALVAGFRIGPSLLEGAFEGAPDFETMDSPIGFRRISGGSVSSGFDPFAGLDNTRDQLDPETLEEVRSNICAALYEGIAEDSETIPIASFSDYYCPYCRVQTKRLAELDGDLGAEVAVAWHELPLLGETSLLAARAALAAKRQGAYAAFHESLLTSAFQANPEYLSLLSDRIGVDHARLLQDIESEDVTRELQTSAALSRLFGFVGTPAMVVGRTVIQGEVSDRTLRRIVELEREEGWRSVC